MKTKDFYHAFNALYDSLKEPLHLQQKEKLYLILFKDAYPPDDVVQFDSDADRRITSGG